MRYLFGGIYYEILDERKEQILRDFQYLEQIKDYQTIKNRITNGVLYSWLKVVKNEQTQKTQNL
jgi:hypothetical protein